MSALDVERRQRFELARIRALVAELMEVHAAMMSAAWTLATTSKIIKVADDDSEWLEENYLYEQEKRRLNDTVREYRHWRRKLEDAVFNYCITNGWLEPINIPHLCAAIFDFDGKVVADRLFGGDGGEP